MKRIKTVVFRRIWTERYATLFGVQTASSCMPWCQIKRGRISIGLITKMEVLTKS